MMAWAVLSIAQALFLPGLIVALLVRDLERIDRFVLAPAASLVVNYFIVLLLVLLHVYTRTVLVGLVAAELLVLAWLTKGRRGAPRELRSARVVLAWSGVDAAIGALAVASLVPYLYYAYVQVGTIFTMWDAVMSWNRWAVYWYLGMLPPATYTYPQSVPILYSLVYQFVGDPVLQMFARTLALLYPFVAVLTLARTAWVVPRSRRIVLVSIPVFVWFIGQQTPGLYLVFSGYVDAVIAYFGILAVYLFALLHQRHADDRARFWDDPLLRLALVIVAGGALVKQTGGFLAILFPLALYWYIGRNGVAFWRTRRFWGWALLYAFIVGHWYVFKIAQYYLGIDRDLAQGYAELIPVSAAMRPAYGVRLFFDAVGWWFAPPFVLGLLNPVARRMAIWFVLPLFLIWAFTVSYDLRGLFIAMPWIALVSAAGCALAIRWATLSPIASVAVIGWFAALASDLMGRSPAMMHKVGPVIPLAFHYGLAVALVIAVVAWRTIGRWDTGKLGRILLVCVGLLCATALVAHYSSPEFSRRLRDSSLAQQRKLGDPALNAYLLDYFARHPSTREGDVATAYQYMAFVPGLESHFRFASCTWNPRVFLDSAVQYFLASFACSPEANDSIVGHLQDARKIASLGGNALYKLHAAGEAPSPGDAEPDVASLGPEASSSVWDDEAIVANNYTDSEWIHGVGTRAGIRDMFFFLAQSPEQSPLKVGMRLHFSTSGDAIVKELIPVAQGGRYAVFVRVDRKLDPNGDGFPYPIAIKRPTIAVQLVQEYPWIAGAVAVGLILLQLLTAGIWPSRRRISEKAA